MLALLTTSAATESETETGSSDEASADARRIERLAWFAVVALLVITDGLPDWLGLHNGLTPLAAGLLFLGSGLMQRRQAGLMRLSTWVAGLALLATAGFNFFSRPGLDLSLIVVLSAAMLIVMSIFSRKSQAG